MIRCDSETCVWSLYVHDKGERICLKEDVRLEHSEEDGYNLVCHTFEERGGDGD